MFYKDWKVFYNKIAEDLNLPYEKEKKAANIFNNILTNDKIKLLSERSIMNLTKNKEIVIFGAGPDIEKSLIKNINFLKDKILITADGATSALIEQKIIPDIIVTDLDGKISDLLKANMMGSKIVLHAHGDNIDKIQKYSKKFPGEILGTIQINPETYSNLHNFGGFTDGDRAVFLSDHFKAKKIYLIGFSFNGEIGRYSFAKNKDKAKKIKKLRWCELLIHELNKKNNNIVFL